MYSGGDCAGCSTSPLVTASKENYELCQSKDYLFFLKKGAGRGGREGPERTLLATARVCSTFPLVPATKELCIKPIAH